MSKRPTPQQITALRAVAAGRVEWGNEHPAVARRQSRAGNLVFILDGYGVYGGQHATFGSLEANGWIIERVDLLPTKTLPAETRTGRGIAGSITIELPERTVPADDGWRATVELTAGGRAVLESVR